MSVIFVTIASTVLVLCFTLIENAIDPNMSKLARVGFRIFVIFILGVIAIAAMSR